MVSDGSEKFARFHSKHEYYLDRYNAVPTRHILRFMFGFRLKAKSEHEATLVRRWYDAYTAQVWRRRELYKNHLLYAAHRATTVFNKRKWSIKNWLSKEWKNFRSRLGACDTSIKGALRRKFSPSGTTYEKKLLPSRWSSFTLWG